MTRKNHKRGFSLIEAAIVLGVVGLVIGGIWYAAATVSENLKVNETYTGVMSIVNEVQGLISQSQAAAIGNFVDITTTLSSTGALPKNWNGVNPFGGSITVESRISEFRLYLYDIPSSACTKLLTKISTNGVGNGSLTLIGFYDGSSSWSDATFPIPTTTAASHCATQIQMSFDFSYTHIN